MPFKPLVKPVSVGRRMEGDVRMEAFSNVATLNPDISVGGGTDIIVSAEGTPEGTRPEINFIQGTGVTITVTDDAGNDRVDVEIEATGGGGHTIRDNGSDETARDALNFISSPTITFSATDDAGNNETEVTAVLNPSADLDNNARVGVRKNSAGSTFERRRINLIEGSGVTLTVSDDSGDEEVDVTVATSSSGLVGVGRHLQLESAGTPGFKYDPDFNDEWDEFYCNSIATGTIGKLGWLTGGTGGSLAVAASIAGHPCILSISSGSSANRNISLPGGFHHTDIEQVTFILRLTSGNTTGANRSCTLGFGVTPANGAFGAESVYFRFHPATNGNDNWWGFVRDAAADSDSFDTGISGLNTNWHEFTITRQSSVSYTLYVDRVFQDALTGPFPGSVMFPAIRLSTGDATSIIADVDFYHHRTESMSPRFP
jgi:hypothetical protein